MPKRTKSSARWLAEHANDEYVKRAQREGWRSRAVFKLAEIQEAEGTSGEGASERSVAHQPTGASATEMA